MINIEQALAFFKMTAAEAYDTDAVRKRYRELLKKHHPDISGEKTHGFTIQIIDCYRAILSSVDRKETGFHNNAAIELIFGWIMFFFLDGVYKKNSSPYTRLDLKAGQTDFVYRKTLATIRQEYENGVARLPLEIKRFTAHFLALYEKDSERSRYQGAELGYYRHFMRVRANVESVIITYFNTGQSMDVRVSTKGLEAMIAFGGQLIKDIEGYIILGKLFRIMAAKYPLFETYGRDNAVGLMRRDIVKALLAMVHGR